MFKRFMCIAAALMLLAGTAVGEGAYQASITFAYSQEAAAVAVKELANDESQQASLAEALIKLIEGTKIELTMQDSGARCAVILQDEPLLDFTVFGMETDGYILSNLLPKHYVHASIGQDEADANAKAMEQLNKTDWTSVFEDASAEAAIVLENAYTGQETGNFMGDAYEGGARRIAFSFDDSTIAALVDAVINVLADHGIDDALLSSWVGAEGLLASLVAYNGEIAAANQYGYTLYIVLNEENAPVGVSLLTTRADEQVMTISLGFGDNGWHAVWGYGLNEENIYIDCVLIDGAIETEKDFSLTVYKDPYREGFRSVEPYLDYMQLLYTGTIGFADHEDGAAWYADVECFEAGASEPSEWCRLEGACSYQAETVNQTIAWYLSNEEHAQPAEAIHFTFAPCEPMPLVLDDLQELNVEEASFESEFAELMNEAAGDLMVKLFKTIPASLLMYFMQ